MGRKTTPLENNQPRPDRPDNITGRHEDQSAHITHSSCRASETHGSAIGHPPSYGERQPTEAPFQKVIAIFTVILGFSALVTNFQTCRALHEGRDSAHAAQRAYVAFGSKTGQLAETTNQQIENKPIIVLHFFNAGQTTARHFIVHIYGSQFTHIHRYKFEGMPWTEGQATPGEMDLAAQAEHLESITDPKLLRTEKQLADPKATFVIRGEFEYCDIFGSYHCQQLSTRYSPLTGKFDPFLGADLACLIEQPDPRVFEGAEYEGKWFKVKEIEPCKQPSEPEYYRQPTPSPQASPKPTK